MLDMAHGVTYACIVAGNRQRPGLDSRSVRREAASNAAFLLSGVALWAGRTGGRKACRRTPGKSNPFGSARPDWTLGARFATNRSVHIMNNTAIIPVFSGTIAGQSTQLCNARDLHAFLGASRDFSTWIKARIDAYGFSEGADYLLTKIGEQLPSGTKYRIDYHLSLDMAKELAMVERTDKGREVRRYFIECERRALAGETTPSLRRQSGPTKAELKAYLEILNGKSGADVPEHIEQRINTVMALSLAKTAPHLSPGAVAFARVHRWLNTPR